MPLSAQFKVHANTQTGQVDRLLVFAGGRLGWTGQLLGEGFEAAAAGARLRDTPPPSDITSAAMKQPGGPAAQRAPTHLLQEGPFPARVLEEVKSYPGNE